ncbi:RagB/SusD family nutrient uptake outer membrane protein [Olivibacter sp. SDN3]|uniref:RagB/SusD family nutrient uptake outer membrane protein n=1 Tax=Olivibacter sp. SDN3 TaxID=2764720 RepID=UPI00165128ED|nr:RagB/SusD family nutrient uptake outer membrane protein [Olivibacter sp. SDN3]QNL52285.1 RagB/SusD family nutrient uptake outer membrane protein [Olivibacter sp. SDN3]
MKAKYIALFVTVTGITSGLTSCNKFTDLNPISEATSGNAYTSLQEAEAALTGAYDALQQEYYIWDNVIFSDVMADNYYAGGDDPEIFAVDRLQLVPTNGRLFNNWSQLYVGVLRANTILQEVPVIDDPSLDEGGRREQILGEALFLRANHYYNLVKMFGGVPLVLEPAASTAPDAIQLPRNTEAEVYQQILADLEQAVSYLPDRLSEENSVNKARATKGAANALLAKVYAQKADRDYGKVLEHCDAVINSPANYRLLANFAELFDGAHYNNAESILEIQFVGANEGNWGPQMLLPPSISGDTWRKFITPSTDLVAAFDRASDETRKSSSILFENVGWLDEYWGNASGSSVPFAYKWKSASGWASTNRQYMLRLADIMLLKAEALNELGRVPEALEALNQVRQRVGLAASTASDQTTLKLAILEERRLELCQEGQRWDDLKRAGLAIEVMNDLQEIDLRTGNAVDYNMTEEKLLLPIPQQEINRNQQLDQNPGY